MNCVVDNVLWRDKNVGMILWRSQFIMERLNKRVLLRALIDATWM